MLSRSSAPDAFGQCGVEEEVGRVGPDGKRWRRVSRLTYLRRRRKAAFPHDQCCCYPMHSGGGVQFTPYQWQCLERGYYKSMQKSQVDQPARRERPGVASEVKWPHLSQTALGRRAWDHVTTRGCRTEECSLHSVVVANDDESDQETTN